MEPARECALQLTEKTCLSLRWAGAPAEAQEASPPLGRRTVRSARIHKPDSVCETFEGLDITHHASETIGPLQSLSLRLERDVLERFDLQPGSTTGSDLPHTSARPRMGSGLSLKSSESPDSCSPVESPRGSRVAQLKSEGLALPRPQARSGTDSFSSHDSPRQDGRVRFDSSDCDSPLSARGGSARPRFDSGSSIDSPRNSRKKGDSWKRYDGSRMLSVSGSQRLAGL